MCDSPDPKKAVLQPGWRTRKPFIARSTPPRWPSPLSPRQPDQKNACRFEYIQPILRFEPDRTMAGGAGECGPGHGPAPAVRAAPVGRRLLRPLRRVLARTRQCLLGRHIGRPGLPAASRRVAAQGMVPHDRHRGGRGGDRAADGGVPAGARPLPDRPGAVGRGLRPGRHAAPQLRGLCGGAGGLHRRDHRQRPAGRHRRPQRPRLHAGRHARQRDLDRHRLRRHRPRRDRSRRRAAAPGRFVRGPCGGNRQPVRGHVGAHRATVFGAAGDPRANCCGASSRSTRPSTKRSGNPRSCAFTRPSCSRRWRACSQPSPPGARSRCGSRPYPTRRPAKPTPCCRTCRPNFVRRRRRAIRRPGSKIPWRCGSTARPPFGD